MFSHESRCIYEKNQLIEVICQLRFPDILKIEAQEPYAFQDAIRGEYPQYAKKVEQLPPQQAGGKLTPQGTVNNYQFISADSQWKVSLTKSFIALSTHGYTRWEEFAQRLDRILAAFIQAYQPAYFSRVGLRYINAFRKAELGLENAQWRELIQPGYLGLMGDDDAQEALSSKTSRISRRPCPAAQSATSNAARECCARSTTRPASRRRKRCSCWTSTSSWRAIRR